jgi:peptide/nickel transport system permease protein
MASSTRASGIADRRPDAIILVCLFVVGVVSISAGAAPLLTVSPSKQDMTAVLMPPSAAHPLGTDNLGRDLLARLVHGARVSLVVGTMPVVLAILAGGALGLLTGYVGGVLDLLAMRVIDVILALPAIILALSISAFLGQGLQNVIVAIVVVYIPVFARLTRGQVLSLREREFVIAANALGGTARRIIIRHIVPNVMGPVIVQASISVGLAIIIEASMSFLGVGVRPPTATWGGMLKEGYPYIRLAPWLALWPGLAIFITVLAVSLLGDTFQEGGRQL